MLDNGEETGRNRSLVLHKDAGNFDGACKLKENDLFKKEHLELENEGLGKT